MSRVRRRRVFVCAGAFAMACAAAASTPLELDVRGLKLGMTPPQAHAAIRAEGLPATQRPTTVALDQHDFYIDEVRINKRDDLAFVSSMVSRPRLTDGTRRIREIVVAAFTPPPSATQAWGIGYERTYQAQDMPQLPAVLQRLTAKYGRPSWTQGFEQLANRTGRGAVQPGGGAMLWYWDRAGRQLGPAIREACRAALHNSYIVLGRGGFDPRAGNSTTSRSTLFTGATEAGLRAGCAKVVRAKLQWTAEGLVSSISVEAMDVELARRTSDQLVIRLGEIEAQASRQRVEAARGNRPDF